MPIVIFFTDICPGLGEILLKLGKIKKKLFVTRRGMFRSQGSSLHEISTETQAPRPDKVELERWSVTGGGN